ncbi:EamA family transporter [Paenibacillus planticolens]|uniref:EamA family transporter n=1 Tax=Paenibacillus planticolens TaxID=2654976 RepID=A0ABX1ZJN0_9BACL|nr:EamA family transporter [Paenibacillus planticolens]NOV00271.1 EamA family transporter [Paenibacillus planticolens]
MNYLLILISILLSSFGQIFMKNGANQLILYNGKLKILVHLITNVSIISGLFLYGLSTIIWIVALSRTQLSIAYPMVSFSYIIIAIASYFIFNEPLNAQKIIGLLIIVIGVIFISKS